jgi:60kDa lysophospholipase
MDLSLPSDESKVLIIYTGGTIGMLVGENGYVPEPYFLTETLRSQARFHDPLQDSLFSYASSVAGFRLWSSSGTSSPRGTEFAATPTTPMSAAVSQQPTLVVRSSRPMDVSHTSNLSPMAVLPPRGAAQPSSVKIADDVYESRLPALVTPRSATTTGSGRKRIRYAVLEVSPEAIKRLKILTSLHSGNRSWIAATLKLKVVLILSCYVPKSPILICLFLLFLFFGRFLFRTQTGFA